MKLNESQIRLFSNHGFLLIEDLFSTKEIMVIKEAMSSIFSINCPERILERSGSVRSFFQPEKYHQVFYTVNRLKRLVEISEALLGTGIHIYQSKINSKKAMVGDWWEWHQDFTFWSNDDGMRYPNVLTAMIFLDPVTEFNGPLFLIPGSHLAGTCNKEENAFLPLNDSNFSDYQNSTFYMSALTSNLKYTLKQDTIEHWIKKNGIFSAKGEPGTVLFFHGNIFHSSSNNLSPWDRNCLLITYNSVENTLMDVENPRPPFLCNRDQSPLISIKDSSLLSFTQ